MQSDYGAMASTLPAMKAKGGKADKRGRNEKLTKGGACPLTLVAPHLTSGVQPL